jgi:hypothetical protein
MNPVVNIGRVQLGRDVEQPEIREMQQRAADALTRAGVVIPPRGPALSESSSWGGVDPRDLGSQSVASSSFSVQTASSGGGGVFPQGAPPSSSASTAGASKFGVDIPQGGELASVGSGEQIRLTDQAIIDAGIRHPKFIPRDVAEWVEGVQSAAGSQAGSAELQRTPDSPTAGMQMPPPILREPRGSERDWERLSETSRRALSEMSEALPCEERVKQRVLDMLPTEENLQALADQGGMMGNIARVVNNNIVKNINRALAYPYVRGAMLGFAALLTPTFIMQVQSVSSYLWGGNAERELNDNTVKDMKETINKLTNFINTVYNASYTDNALQNFVDRVATLNKAQKELNKNNNVNVTLPQVIMDDVMKSFFSAVKQQHVINKTKKKKKSNWGKDKLHIPIKHTAYGEPQLPGS